MRCSLNICYDMVVACMNSMAVGSCSWNGEEVPEVLPLAEEVLVLLAAARGRVAFP